jgi:hypothetical protein
VAAKNWIGAADHFAPNVDKARGPGTEAGNAWVFATAAE